MAGRNPTQREQLRGHGDLVSGDLEGAGAWLGSGYEDIVVWQRVESGTVVYLWRAMRGATVF